MDDIFCIQVVRMPWFDTRLGHLKKEKRIYLIYVLYILYTIYIVYFLYVYYISYILHIYIRSKVCVIYIGLHLHHILGDQRDR